jgi:CRISPR-associated protein (TIGR03986 family)
MITAPYNFVPLNKEVFYPSWSEQVSHDVPFSDGESGEIDITITAKSPIFIRNHSDAKEKPSSEFCNFNKTKFIPATSLKGVMRTAIEIIGFSKLQLQDKTLSYRDLNNPSYKTKAMDGEKIYMGWLSKDDNQWVIENLGKVTNGQTRIKYEEMKSYFTNEQMSKITKDRATAYDKYSAIDFEPKQIDKGTIVFTGSTGNKTREFLFPNIQPISTYRFDKDDNLIKTFKEAYYIGTPNESKDWKNLWQKRFDSGKKIPVFFQLNDKEEIKHFGLSMLYKLPYEHSLQKILEKYQDFKLSKDLAQTIFGYIDENEALKGRVQFSHFKCDKEVKFNKKISLPLSTPRATFYPNYLVQCCENGKTKKFITYDRLDGILRGFKLYPPTKQIVEIAKNDKGEDFCKKNHKLCNPFEPVGVGSTFSGKIRFHNLNPVELGALISALNFMGQNKDDKYFHKIGMAKAYGFGTVSIQINSLKTASNKGLDLFMNSFKNHLNQELKIDLLQHPRIKAFLKLSSYSFEDKELQVMELKGFTNAKKDSNKFCLSEVVEAGYDKSKLCKQSQQTQSPNKSSTKNQKSNASAKDLNDFFKNR